MSSDTKTSIFNIKIPVLFLTLFRTQRFQKLICLHLFTDCFMKIFRESSEQIQLAIFSYLHALNVIIIFFWRRAVFPMTKE